MTGGGQSIAAESRTGASAAPAFVRRGPAPSRDAFVAGHLRPGTPAIFEGMLDHWPARRKWSLEFFRQHYASAQVWTFPVRERLIQANAERGSANDLRTLEDCLHSVARPSGEGGVAITTWFNGLPPSLQDDVRVPGLCAGARWMRSRLWITPAQTSSPTHQDLYENLYAVVRGAKRFYLYPPRPRDVMYPHSPFSRAPNIGRVNPERPDYGRFPRFREAQPVIADLGPGDLLFLPSLWWHYTSSLETTIAVNFWWARGWKLPLAWLASTYREWRGI